MNNLKFFHVVIPQGEKHNPKREKIFLQFLDNLYQSAKDKYFSFEILGRARYIYFYIVAPKEVANIVTNLIYGTFPAAEILESSDYTKISAEQVVVGTVLRPSRRDVYPFRTFDQFENDSLAGLASFISKISSGEEAWVQFVVSPRRDNWRYHFGQRKKRFEVKFGRFFRLKDYFRLKTRKEFCREEETAFNKKADNAPFQVSIRIGFLSADVVQAKTQLKNLARTFSQFNTLDFNEFRTGNFSEGEKFLVRYRARRFDRTVYFSATELASLYHFPNPDFVPHLIHVLAKKSEPPQDLPQKIGNEKLSFFGQTNYHNSNLPFGILREDRRRHVYAVGKSGTGKSKFLELLIQQDITDGEGVGVLDPHGDLIDNILTNIPENRKKDVIYFDAGDIEYPIAFNPLANIDSKYKMQITIGFIDIFKKLFGGGWTHRLEHVLRYTVLALLDTPDTTAFSILKMLSDKNYRQNVISRIEDSVVKNFWVNEFASWSEKFDAEAITPLLNKVGQFIATPMIRNIVGQPKSSFDIRDLMDKQKILLIKISKGILGEENTSLLGALIITKIYQAAMSRAEIQEKDRKDFHLYIDEFQNFATDTFYEILSEARKYHLNLTIAHQYLGQLTEKIRTTVFGNVGTIINFRTGAKDAKILAEEYTPTFNSRDIVNLAVRDFYIKMSVNGEVREAFSGRTLDVVQAEKDFSQEIIEISRERYATPRKEVEQFLKKWEEKIEVKQIAKSSDQKFAEPLI